MTQLLKQYENLTTCPICSSKLESKKSAAWDIINYCNKDCFSYSYSEEDEDILIMIKIFEECFVQDNYYSKITQEETKEEIDEEITHWRENDRYILKWMDVE